MRLLAALGDLDRLTSDEVLVAQNVAFAVMAVTMVLAALRMVTTRNVVHAALYLVVVLAGAAGQFVLLGAEFVGVTQVMVYIGAIVVLFLFGIMLTKGSFGEDDGVTSEKRLMAGLVGLLVFGVMTAALVDSFEDAEVARAAISIATAAPEAAQRPEFGVEASSFLKFLGIFERSKLSEAPQA